MVTYCKNADSNFMGEAETLTVTVTKAGTYYVIVDTYSTSSSGQYTLNVK